MGKNLILFVVLIGLFVIDIIKVKLYPEEIPKPPAPTEEKKDDPEAHLQNLTEDDLKLDDSSEKQKENKEENDVEQPEAAGDKLLIHIKHCTSYAGRVDNFKKGLQGSIANIDIQTSTYPAPENKQMISKAVTILQYVLIAFIMMGQTLKTKLTFIPAAVFDFIESKKIMLGIFCYFGVSQIQNVITQTGAFEIYANNELVYSTLTEKLMPTVERITEILNEMNLIPDIVQ